MLEVAILSPQSRKFKRKGKKGHFFLLLQQVFIISMGPCGLLDFPRGWPKSREHTQLAERDFPIFKIHFHLYLYRKGNSVILYRWTIVVIMCHCFGHVYIVVIWLEEYITHSRNETLDCLIDTSNDSGGKRNISIWVHHHQVLLHSVWKSLKKVYFELFRMTQNLTFYDWFVALNFVSQFLMICWIKLLKTSDTF